MRLCTWFTVKILPSFYNSNQASLNRDEVRHFALKTYKISIAKLLQILKLGEIMKTFRIVLWSLIAVIVVGMVAVSFDWTKNTTSNEAAFGGPFKLIDQNGAEITEAAFAEKPAAVFFGFTHCPEICPTTLYELDGWLDAADPSGEKINAYFVSVDPEKDTAEILNTYVSNVTDRIKGITGPLDDVSAMLRDFKVYFKKVPLDANDPDGDYTMDHTASVLLFHNGGRFKSTIAYGENPDTAIQKLKNLVEG